MSTISFDTERALCHLTRFRHSVSFGASLSSGEEQREYQQLLKTIDSVNKVVSQRGLLSPEESKLLNAVFSEYEKEQKNFAAPIPIQSFSIPSAPPKPASEYVLDHLLGEKNQRTIWFYTNQPSEEMSGRETPPFDLQKTLCFLLEIRHAFVVGTKILPNDPTGLLSCEDILKAIDSISEELSQGRSFLPKKNIDCIQMIMDKFWADPEKTEIAPKPLYPYTEEDLSFRLDVALPGPKSKEIDCSEDRSSKGEKRHRARTPLSFSLEQEERDFSEDEAPESKKQHISSYLTSFTPEPEDNFILDMESSFDQMQLNQTQGVFTKLDTTGII